MGLEIGLITNIQEEVLFTVQSEGARKIEPIRIFTYPGGLMDLHCQTGEFHVSAIVKAKEILKERGLKLSDEKPEIGSTGAYYSIEKI